MSKSSFWLFCVWLCSFSVAGEEYPQALRVLHDPFRKPAIPQQSVAEPDNISKPSTQPSWTPRLTATLRAGQNSMANVNGRIIKLGETINGYKLVKVDERSAVFVKNKQRKKLMIDDEKNKPNETNY
ncbi:MAG: hypothetical protein HOO87_17810 [Methyloglobulus sp.]|nr:hypothetical protein [Methyloglobulus sp.]